MKNKIEKTKRGMKYIWKKRDYVKKGTIYIFKNVILKKLMMVIKIAKKTPKAIKLVKKGIEKYKKYNIT